MNLNDFSCEQISAMKQIKPNIIISKNPTPIIYLDTCLLIEFSKYENNCCDNAHKREIVELYETLVSLMKSKRIICVLGNQMEEMGATQNREKSRKFLYKFTNAIFLEPFKVENIQTRYGYNAFINRKTEIEFSSADVFQEPCRVRDSSIEILLPTIYKQEKAQRLRKTKENLAFSLNAIKNRGMISMDYEKQLAAELRADFDVHRYILEHYKDSVEAYTQTQYHLSKIFKLAGIDLMCASSEERKKAVEIYCHFLFSKCHQALPYVWIRSVLFVHLMQRSNKIIPSDNWDIIWASSYLPFVDYVVTDVKFNTLLNNSGLLIQYNTRGYNMKTLKDLLNDLKCIPISD